MPDEQRDFFVSFNKADRDWAEWIAWTLESSGYTVYIQSWDFTVGSNFVVKMDEASRQSRATVLVLSASFLKSGFTQAEWTVAFATDPTGEQGKLIPVKVRECEPEGLLKTRVYTDVTGLAPERAQEVLLAAVSRTRAKPQQAIAFPGTVTIQSPPPSPKAKLAADPVLWLYLSTPSLMDKADCQKLIFAAKATGPTNLVTPEDSKSLERADAAIFVVDLNWHSDDLEAWRKRLRRDLEVARDKKIRHLLCLPASTQVNAPTLLPKSLWTDLQIRKYIDFEVLAHTIRKDLSEAREGLLMAGDLDWYLNDEHREVLMAMRAANYEQAFALCSVLLKRRPFSPRGRYNMACILSRQAHETTGKKRKQLLDDAEKSLVSAVNYGFIDFARRTAFGDAESHEKTIDQIRSDLDLQTLFDFRPSLAANLGKSHAQILGGTATGWGTGDGCIDGFMPVDMSEAGALPLNQLTLGHQVVSWDEASGTKRWSEVRSIRKHIANELLIVNGCLRVTPHHPILTREGWKKAEDIAGGDQLLGPNGNHIPVSSITRVAGEFTVFDLNVEPYRNLSVCGIIVHNDKY